MLPVEGYRGGARRLARLLGHRAEGPLHPALLHLLAASPLHGRVYVPPPPALAASDASAASAASAVPSAPVALRAYDSGDEEGRREEIDEGLVERGHDETLNERIDQRSNEGDGERLNERQRRPRRDIQGGGGSESRQGAGAGILPLFPELAVVGVVGVAGGAGGGPISAGGGFALSPSHLSPQTWSGAIAAQMTRTTVPTAPGNTPVPSVPGISGEAGAPGRTSASSKMAKQGGPGGQGGQGGRGGQGGSGGVTRSEAKAVSEFAAAGLSAAAIAVMEKLTPKLRDAAKQALAHAHLLMHIFSLPPLFLISFSLTSSLSISLSLSLSLSPPFFVSVEGAGDCVCDSEGRRRSRRARRVEHDSEGSGQARAQIPAHTAVAVLSGSLLRLALTFSNRFCCCCFCLKLVLLAGANFTTVDLSSRNHLPLSLPPSLLSLTRFHLSPISPPSLMFAGKGLRQFLRFLRCSCRRLLAPGRGSAGARDAQVLPGAQC